METEKRTRREFLAGAAAAGLVYLDDPPLAWAAERSRVEFTRLVAHWDEYTSPEYLRFIDEVRPEVAQVGFYGAHFWSLAHTPQYKGYPAHLPMQGLAECGRWFEDLNGELHRRRVKVVGHFNVTFLVGEPDGPKGPTGFFKFYHDLWDEKELGPKPVANPLDLLEKEADGSPRVTNSYSIGGMKEHHACLNNPHWRAVLKAWAKRGIARGVDGFIINYFYRHNCLCDHCREGFRKYLTERFSSKELSRRFGIPDLASYELQEIVGWHDPRESTPLRREMLRFSQLGTKQAFDEVFVRHGRSLKPDLIVAQWNHLGDFGQISVDERCMLPAETWGRDEDYLWYSTGGAACFTDLAEGILGEGTLQARYLRGTFDDKPFVLGKYEQTRIRAAIAELAANGGAAMGFYARIREPETRREIARYYSFLERNDSAYRGSRPHAEVLLVYPRIRVHDGDVAAVDAFKQTGRRLLDLHVLFDVIPDDMVTEAKRATYRKVLQVPYPEQLTEEAFTGLSRFQAPTTVRVSASRPTGGKELTLHLVNYNRREPEKKRSPGRGFVDDNPIATPEIQVDLAGEWRGAEVLVSSPEEPEPRTVKASVAAGRLTFSVPPFLVYAIARIVQR